jgi:hypothetical protein
MTQREITAFERLLKSPQGRDIVQSYYNTFKKDILKDPALSARVKTYLSGGKITPTGYTELSKGMAQFNGSKNIKILTELTKKKQAYINNTLASNNAELKQMQIELFNSITKKYIPSLKTEAGNLLSTKENFYSLSKFDKVISDFNKTYNDPYVANLSETMLQTANYSEAYYLAAGGGDQSLKAALKATETIKARLGVLPDGGISKSGYIGRLSEMPEVTTTLKDYVTQNIVGKKSVSEFVSGFNEIVNGSKNIDGALVKYSSQYANDTYNQVDNAINEFVAEESGLEYFIYSGTIMRNTRCFCSKRVGKVFSVEDAARWVDDPTLPQSTTEPSYNPLVDLGRWNCRHSLSYISEEMAMELGYDPATAEEINKQQC